MELLTVGKIAQTFGIKGEVKVYVTSSFSSIRFKKGNTLLIKDDLNNNVSLEIENAYRKDANFYIVKFKDFDDANQSEELKSKELFAIKDNNILKENEYFYSDLIGLNCFDENNNPIGKVVKIEEFPAQITLRISFNNKEYFVPFNDFFVKEVSIENKTLIIHLIPGLIWKLSS